MGRPVKGVAYNVGVSLFKSDGTLIPNPGTVTAKISKDFGNWADVGTVSEEDTTYSQLKLALTATEFNADVVDLYVVDNTSGCVPFRCTIYTEDAPLTAVAIAEAVRDLATYGLSALYTLLTATGIKVLTNADKGGYSGTATNMVAAPDNAGIAAIKAKTDNLPADPADASDVAAAFGAVPAAVWGASARTLTSFGSLVSDVATAVWTASTRTLTSLGTMLTDLLAALAAAHGAGSWGSAVPVGWVTLTHATLDTNGDALGPVEVDGVASAGVAVEAYTEPAKTNLVNSTTTTAGGVLALPVPPGDTYTLAFRMSGHGEQTRTVIVP